MRKILAVLVLLGLVATACGAGDDLSGDISSATSTSPPDSLAGQEQYRRDAPPVVERPTNTVPGRFDPAAQPIDGQVTGEVPDEILDLVLADAGGRAGGAELQVVVARAEVWSDGSLGCPEPGVSYTQAIVSGYQVVLAGQGGQQDYRIAGNGFFRLCEPAD